MKRVIGLLAAMLIFSLPAWALQHPGGGDGPRAEAGIILRCQRMGLNRITARRTWRRIGTSAMVRATPVLRTSTTMAVGLDMTGARMTRTTISIIHD
jgi:hypothetical protein